MINANYWLSLPSEIRTKLIEAFNMRKVNGVISDSIRGVIDDGYISTLYGVFTVEKMQAFTGSNEKDVYKLFDLCIEKVQNPNPVVEVKSERIIEPVIEQPAEPSPEPAKKTKKTKK